MGLIFDSDVEVSDSVPEEIDCSCSSKMFVW